MPIYYKPCIVARKFVIEKLGTQTMWSIYHFVVEIR